MHSFFVSPAQFDVVAVTGQDSLRFLQGQLTCDVEAVEENGFCYGAACNNKGRVFAAFILIRRQGTYYLCMTAGLGAIFLAALKKYLPFYKCTMQLSDQSLFALAGECVQKLMTTSPVPAHSSSASSEAIPQAQLCLLDSSASRALLLTTQSPLEIQELLQPLNESTLEHWEALAMLAGHYPFRAADAERFTPQELHFDRNGYVSFSKGCYTGQEIVARMHYRGKLKKQLYLLSIESSRIDDSGGSDLIIRKADGTELGHTLLSRTLTGKILALASLPVELVDTAMPLFTGNDVAVNYSPFA
jgi:folate-binding protein YgfZ